MGRGPARRCRLRRAASLDTGRSAGAGRRARAGYRSLGGRVDDAAYARAAGESAAVGVSARAAGGCLLTPPVTLLVAAGLLVLARVDGVERCRSSTALAVTRARHGRCWRCSRSSATPLHYLYESLTSPSSLAGILRVFDEGTLAGAAVRHDRAVRPVVDVAAERWARRRDRRPAAALLVAAAGRLCGCGAHRRRGVRGDGQARES